MLSSTRTALHSWIVVGILLAFVLAVEAYQTRGGGVARDDRDTFMISVLGSRRQAPGATAFEGEGRLSRDAHDGRPDRRVTAVMGSAELDLREANLKSGDELVVGIVAVMGAVVVRVPDGWTIDARAVPLIGGVRDRRLRPFDALDTPPAADGPAPRLVLRGAVVMGELVIKS